MPNGIRSLIKYEHEPESEENHSESGGYSCKTLKKLCIDYINENGPDVLGFSNVNSFNETELKHNEDSFDEEDFDHEQEHEVTANVKQVIAKMAVKKKKRRANRDYISRSRARRRRLKQQKQLQQKQNSVAMQKEAKAPPSEDDCRPGDLLESVSGNSEIVDNLKTRSRRGMSLQLDQLSNISWDSVEGKRPTRSQGSSGLRTPNTPPPGTIGAKSSDKGEKFVRGKIVEQNVTLQPRNRRISRKLAEAMSSVTTSPSRSSRLSVATSTFTAESEATPSRSASELSRPEADVEDSQEAMGSVDPERTADESAMGEDESEPMETTEASETDATSQQSVSPSLPNRSESRSPPMQKCNSPDPHQLSTEVSIVPINKFREKDSDRSASEASFISLSEIKQKLTRNPDTIVNINSSVSILLKPPQAASSSTKTAIRNIQNLFNGGPPVRDIYHSINFDYTRKVRCKYCNKSCENIKVLAEHQLTHLKVSAHKIGHIQMLAPKHRRVSTTQCLPKETLPCIACL